MIIISWAGLGHQEEEEEERLRLTLSHHPRLAKPAATQQTTPCWTAVNARNLKNVSTFGENFIGYFLDNLVDCFPLLAV